MVEKNTAARLQLIFVHKAEDGDIVLAANTGAHNGMVVVNDLLKVANTHGCPSQVINLVPLLFILFLLWLESLLVPDELLLHQQVIFDPLHLEEPEATLGVRSDAWQLVGGIRSLHLLALLANSGWNWRFIFLLLLLFSFLPTTSASSGLLVSHDLKVVSSDQLRLGNLILITVTIIYTKYSWGCSSCFGNHLWVNGFHGMNSILVHNPHSKIRKVQHQPLLNFLDTLNHQVVSLLSSHILPVVSVHQSSCEETSISMSSKVGLDEKILVTCHVSNVLTLIMLAR